MRSVPQTWDVLVIGDTCVTTVITAVVLHLDVDGIWNYRRKSRLSSGKVEEPYRVCISSKLSFENDSFD